MVKVKDGSNCEHTQGIPIAGPSQMSYAVTRHSGVPTTYLKFRRPGAWWENIDCCTTSLYRITYHWWSLHWRHNDHDGVSNHQPHGCLLNRLFRRRSKKTSKLRVTGLCAGNSPGPVNSPYKGPVTRKMFPFDDVIMYFIQFLPGVCFISRWL